MNINEMRRERRRHKIIGTVLLFLIAITGTFAWSGVRNMAFNPLHEFNHGGRFHDHFSPQGDAYRGPGTHDKLLFAENFSGEYIFVRARLREYLSIDHETPPLNRENRPEMTINDPNTWALFTPNPTNMNERAEDSESEIIGELGNVTWQLGDTRETRHTFIPTFNHVTHMATGFSPTVPTQFQQHNAFEMTEAVGHGIDAVSGGHNLNQTVIADVRDVHELIERGQQTGPGLLGHEQSSIRESTMRHGNHRHFPVGHQVTSPRLVIDNNNLLHLEFDEDQQPFVHTARETLTPGTYSVMSVIQWRENQLRARQTPQGQLYGTFWIIDTEANDGWFYFVSPIPPGEGTSLLLNELTFMNDIHRSVTYIISVDAEFSNYERIRNGAWGELAPEIEDLLFTPIPLNLTLDMGDGEGTVNFIIDYNANFTFPEALPEKEGYTFIGWSETTDVLEINTGTPHFMILDHAYGITGERTETVRYNVTDNIVFRPVWRTNHEMTFDARDGVGLPTLIDFRAGGNMEMYLTPPTRTGYDFMGLTSMSTVGRNEKIEFPFDDETDEQFHISIEALPDENIHLYAVWQESSMFPRARIGCPSDGEPQNIFVDSTGHEWCVVRTIGNYSMLVSRHAVNLNGIGGPTLNNRLHHSSGVHMPWPANTQVILPVAGGTHQERGPEGRLRVHGWFNNNNHVSPALRTAAVDAHTPTDNNRNNTMVFLRGCPEPDDEDYDGTCVESTRLYEHYLSTPISGSLGTHPIFFLSEAEAYQLISDEQEGRMMREGPNGQERSYWLRSAGVADFAMIVRYTNGSWDLLSSSVLGNDSEISFRPALWVRR